MVVNQFARSGDFMKQHARKFRRVIKIFESGVNGVGRSGNRKHTFFLGLTFIDLF